MDIKKLERFVCRRAITEIEELLNNFKHTFPDSNYVNKLLNGIREIDVEDAEQDYDGTIYLKIFKIGGETFYSKDNMNKRILDNIREEEIKKESQQRSKKRQVCMIPETLVRFFGSLLSSNDYDIVGELKKGIKYKYIVIMEEMLSRIKLDDYDCDYCFVYGYKTNNSRITSKFPVFFGTDDIKRLIFNYELEKGVTNGSSR